MRSQKNLLIVLTMFYDYFRFHVLSFRDLEFTKCKNGRIWVIELKYNTILMALRFMVLDWNKIERFRTPHTQFEIGFVHSNHGIIGFRIARSLDHEIFGSQIIGSWRFSIHRSWEFEFLQLDHQKPRDHTHGIM